MAIGMNNEAKVMLRLASPTLIQEAMRSAISLSRFLEKPASHSPFQRLVRLHEEFNYNYLISLPVQGLYSHDGSISRKFDDFLMTYNDLNGNSYLAIS
jgi:hypothetical protein